MPLPHRALTSMMLRYNGVSVLVDCGEATQIALRKVGWSPKPIDIMCFTHYHADHISGLPGMLLTMGNAERKEPLHMVGPKGLERVVSSLRVIAPELPFPIIFHELHDNEEEIVPSDWGLDMPDFSLRAFRVNHNVICYGYTFFLKRAGKFDVERATAQGIDRQYWNTLQKGGTVEAENGLIYTPDMVLGPERKGIHLTYTTDTRPTDSIVRNAEGSDLFICEGMYGEPDKKSKAKENKHMMFGEAAEMARQANVKELWLTHYSPSLVNPKEFMGETLKVFPKTIAARDGRMVTLHFPEEG